MTSHVTYTIQDSNNHYIYTSSQKVASPKTVYNSNQPYFSPKARDQAKEQNTDYYQSSYVSIPTATSESESYAKDLYTHKSADYVKLETQLKVLQAENEQLKADKIINEGTKLENHVLKMKLASMTQNQGSQEEIRKLKDELEAMKLDLQTAKNCEEEFKKHAKLEREAVLTELRQYGIQVNELKQKLDAAIKEKEETAKELNAKTDEIRTLILNSSELVELSTQEDIIKPAKASPKNAEKPTITTPKKATASLHRKIASKNYTIDSLAEKAKKDANVKKDLFPKRATSPSAYISSLKKVDSPISSLKKVALPSTPTTKSRKLLDPVSPNGSSFKKVSSFASLLNPSKKNSSTTTASSRDRKPKASISKPAAKESESSIKSEKIAMVGDVEGKAAESFMNFEDDDFVGQLLRNNSIKRSILILD